jgi:hypothetical protein
MFLDLPFTDSSLFERIRIRDLSMPIYLNKVLSMKTKKKRFFVGILKVTDEKSRIRIQIRKVVVYGSTSVPTCHGSKKVNLFELQYRYRFLLIKMPKLPLIHVEIPGFGFEFGS